MKTAAYIRRSTKKQKSLETQKEAIINTAIQHSIDANDITFYNDTRTGRNDKRMNYRTMLKGIEQGLFTQIIVYRINRLGRRLKDTLTFIDICVSKKVKLISVSDGVFDLSKAFDRFKLQVLSSLAEMELDNISDFVKNANVQKIREGKMVSTNAPFGYRYKNGSYHVVQSEADTVKKIFKLYLKGEGYGAIAETLKSDGVLISVPKYQVANILHNKSYTGIMDTPYGPLKASYKAIITTETYEIAQRIRSSKQSSRFSTDTLLKRVVKCPSCGSTLTTHQVKRNHKVHSYYICPHHKLNDTNYCSFISINSKQLEEEVIRTIRQFIVQDQVYDQISESIKKINKKHQLQTMNTQRLKQRLVDQLASGDITIDVFTQQIKQYEQPAEPMISVKSSKSINNALSIASHKLLLENVNHLIDEVRINEDNQLQALYLKGYPVNLVKCKVESSQLSYAV